MKENKIVKLDSRLITANGLLQYYAPDKYVEPMWPRPLTCDSEIQ